MPKPTAVLDSTILVSAFLAEKQLSAQLLRQARRGAFIVCLSDPILAETQRVLLQSEHIRARYSYPDHKVLDFTQGLRSVARLLSDLPAVRGVSRDPNDDMIIACAVKARAHFIVTRDKDLLALGAYQQITMVSPEEFMHWLREQS